MIQFTHKLRRLPHSLLAAAVITALPLAAHAAFDSGSTGEDLAFNPIVNTEVQLPPSGILNYTTVNIPAGVTVTFKKNAANTPVHILASGDVTIAGWIDIRGGDAKDVGTSGDGALGDDGIPGVGGPGGYAGGRGGSDDASQRVEVIRGGAGLGPGGGKGGVEGADGCANGRYYKYIGIGGAHVAEAYSNRSVYSNCNPATFQSNSVPYGSPLLQPLIGGSGGGGGRGGTNYAGSGGGGGGGAILIASSGTIRLTGGTTGGINARGGDSGDVAGTGIGGRGAGGSGGGIRLVATAITGNGSLLTEGGCSRLNGSSRQSCGYAGDSSYAPNSAYAQHGGSPGRVRLEADSVTYSGTSAPAYTVGVPGPVFIASAPAIRIASIAGQLVPASLTGSADVVLPATTTGPVEIVFETINVPLGNMVTLRLVPAYGNPTEVLSPAITGTAASGTTSVMATLPQGPSMLQAMTTYTVTLAMGEALSQYAQNERVEKVRLTVAMGATPTARLITVSGKEYDVPYAVLREAGFPG
ncbi:hypothetical protein [Azonexus sp.]|jgi:hypothetical protein|uniref:hypothetical protein n=1 Tax=Azonexus sp. TaxID=1872668 RepID=UPI00282B8158|nr:hypothetical protein [Azonexus sp.]MDR1995565.1 hypothetical protein [Azonexus sp.]